MISDPASAAFAHELGKGYKLEFDGDGVRHNRL
jgi:hypothetical protein